MGQIFYHMGLLATAEVVESSVTDLIGQDVGQIGPKGLDLFEKALGKVLFIDEAYQLLEGSSHFSKDAVGEIVGALTNPQFQQNIVIILAGYSREMDSLIASNPGLRSRFKRVMTFDGLTGVQCAQLLVQNLARQGLDTADLGIPQYETHREICDLFKSLSKLDDWGNARDVNTLSENIFRAVLLATTDAKSSMVVTVGVVVEALRALVTLRRGTRAQRAIRGGRHT